MTCLGLLAGMAHANIVRRIINGDLAVPNEEPYFAQLLRDYDEEDTGRNGTFNFCGATLISPCHVLTAAHCLYDLDRIDLVNVGAFTPDATANESGFNNSGVESQLVDVMELALPDNTTDPSKAIFIHPQYDDSFLTFGNDLGVIRLEECIDLPFARLARLQDFHELEANETLRAIGFGRKQYNLVNGSFDTSRYEQTRQKESSPSNVEQRCMPSQCPTQKQIHVVVPPLHPPHRDALWAS